MTPTEGSEPGSASAISGGAIRGGAVRGRAAGSAAGGGPVAPPGSGDGGPREDPSRDGHVPGNGHASANGHDPRSGNAPGRGDDLPTDPRGTPAVPRHRARRPGARRPGSRRPGARTALRTRRRRRRVYLFVAMAALSAPLVLAVGWFAWQLDPPTAAGRAAVVEVPQGATLSAIGDRLDRAGVVGSAFAFTSWARITGHGTVRPGTYEIPRNAGIRDALRFLDRGPVDRGKAVVSAGITLGEVALQVDQARGMSGARFLELARSGAVRSRYEPQGVDSLEGLLAPGDYPLSPHDDELALLRRMVARFDQEADRAGLAGAPALGVSPYQAVTVASLVQAEAGVDPDRPLIAAVVYNRLRTGTPLQIDATVVYARGRRDGAITKADMAIASPYNTYRVTGLPPTPIATVGPASLAAALHPADVPYRYYVLIDRDGRHAFATTYEEHQRNVAEARRKGLLP